jgi:uncharacterized membrane protein
MPIKIAITGHRFIENEDVVKQQLAKTVEKIIDDNNGKGIEAYSCLALGADSFFADVAFNNKLPLTAILPFKEKEYLKDFSYNSEKKKLKEYLKKCKTITVFANTLPTTQQVRNEMYLAAGKKLVDNCDILIALWDGKDAIGTGGTGDIVDYATKNNKQVIHLKVNRQNEIEKQHNIKDQEAIDLKEQYEKDWKFTTKMSLVAALILAISVGFHNQFHHIHQFLLGIISTIELCFIAIATFFALRIVSTTKNLKRLGTRLEAERLRVMNKFYLAKINIDPIPTTSKFLSDEYNRLEKKYADKEVSIDDFDASKKYLLNLVDSQINYHLNKPKRLNPEYHKLEKQKYIATILFFIGAIVHTIFAYLLKKEKHEPMQLDFNDWIHNIALCIVIFAPAVFAYIEATIYLKEFTKTKLNSGKMHKFFVDVKQKIENLTAQDIDTFNNLANEIRIQMDAELLDWYEIMKEKKVPVG